jgi:predicted dehydrogenase
MREKIKIGLLGLGHLGKIHLDCLLRIEEFEVMGVFDPNIDEAYSNNKGVRFYESEQELIKEVDAIDIVTTTTSHYTCASLAIEKGVHCFIEKPLADTLQNAKKILDEAQNKDLIMQVGHIERINPAYETLRKHHSIEPLFIEAHRLSEFKPRSTDVSVIHDLMIHDIDIVLNLVKAPIVKVNASGVSVLNSTIDIANARLEFENGCVANLTSSRISLKNERKMRIFQPNQYITLDFLKKETHIFELNDLVNEFEESDYIIDLGETKKKISYTQPKVENYNAIEYELKCFAHSILNKEKPIVTLKEAYRNLEVVEQINDAIEELKQNAISYEKK